MTGKEATRYIDPIRMSLRECQDGLLVQTRIDFMGKDDFIAIGVMKTIEYHLERAIDKLIMDKE